jgi:hypothetical protein
LTKSQRMRVVAKVRRLSRKMPEQCTELFSGLEEYRDPCATSCLQNVSAHSNFARSESENMSHIA